MEQSSMLKIVLGKTVFLGSIHLNSFQFFEYSNFWKNAFPIFQIFEYQFFMNTSLPIYEFLIFKTIFWCLIFWGKSVHYTIYRSQQELTCALYQEITSI